MISISNNLKTFELLTETSSLNHITHTHTHTHTHTQFAVVHHCICTYMHTYIHKLTPLILLHCTDVHTYVCMHMAVFHFLISIIVNEYLFFPTNKIIFIWFTTIFFVTVSSSSLCCFVVKTVVCTVFMWTKQLVRGQKSNC